MSRRRLYPWEDWFAQPRVELVRGVDYHISTSTMLQTVQNNARLYGVRVRMVDLGDRLVVWTAGRHLEVTCGPQ